MTVHATLHPTLTRPDTKPNALQRRLESLAPLTMDDLLAVSRLTKQVRTVPAGVDLARPGTRLDHTTVVLDGFACRYKLRKNGRRQNLAWLLAGDVSDIDGVILGRSTQAIATLSPCKIVQVPAVDLLDLIEHHPSVTRALRIAKLIDEAITREWLMQLGCHSASERTAHLFCELLIRLGAVDLVQGGNSYDFPLPQSALADTLGLSAVHVNRSLQALRQEGWIVLKHGRLHIEDLERLKDHAEFSGDYLHTNFGHRMSPSDLVPTATGKT